MKKVQTAFVVVISMLQLYGEACRQSCDNTTQFQCEDGSCKPKSHVCNGLLSCPHGDDEWDCNCGSEPPKIDNMASYSVHFRGNQDYSAPYRLGAKVRYACEIGYQLRGPTPICIKRRWSEHRPICVGCESEPPGIINMTSHSVNHTSGIRHKAPYYPGSTVVYVCKTGYLPHGSAPICSETGRWSAEKTICTSCESEPPIVTNMASYSVHYGTGMHSRAPYYPGSTVAYVCETGYGLQGLPPRCSETGRWSGQKPTCTGCESDPPEVTNAASYTVHHGNYRRPKAPYYPGSTVIYDCKIGYLLQGSAPRCSETGRWSEQKPICTGCESEPPGITNMTSYSVHHGTGMRYEAPYYPGSIVTYVCETGYELQGPAPRCSETGRWSGGNSTCTGCESEPPEIINMASYSVHHGTGMRYQAPYYPGSTVAYVCKTGYRLQGLAPRCSETGRWSGEKAICTGCESEPPEIDNMASYSVHFRDSRDYSAPYRLGSNVRYVCQIGYQLRGPTPTCMRSGWSEHRPICVGCESEPPQIINMASYSVHHQSGIRYKAPYYLGSTLAYVCETGYELQGPAPRCNETGRWSAETSSCTGCESEPPRITNMASYSVHHGTSMRYEAPYYPGSAVAYVCETGYVLQGSAPTCNETSMWSEEKPICTGCESEPPEIDNMVSYSVYYGSVRDYSAPYRIGSNVRYICKTGYKLRGSTPSCMKRRWSGYRPICVGCENEPPGITNMTSYSVHHGTGMQYKAPYYPGSTVAYACDTGYELQGPTPTCSETGRWSGKKPNCTEMCRSEPPRIQHMANYDVVRNDDTKDFRPYSNGSFVEYYCDRGYTLEGSIPTCRNGKWSEEKPICVAELSTCGQSEKVAIYKFANLWRIVGGYNAEEYEFPWQVLITERRSSINACLDTVLGGGSIINRHWILTAAHVLNYRVKLYGRESYTIFVGISERPGQNETVDDSVEVYVIGEYFEHPKFGLNTKENDIALIKVGARLNSNMIKIRGTDIGLTYKNGIRPVCFPCTGSCLKQEDVVDVNGVPLITEGMSDEEKCRIEESFLLTTHEKVIVTGFGHVNQSDSNSYTVRMSKKLQQTLMQIEDKATCEDGIKNLTKTWRKKTGKDLKLKFTENMICCQSGILGIPMGSCKGDSGGPLVRRLECSAAEKKGKIKPCWVQIGIVSFGYGCGRDDIPGYFTNVARYITWIKTITDRQLQDCYGGFLYQRICYFTVFKRYVSRMEADRLCISSGGEIADILDADHQKIVEADVRGKILSSYQRILWTGMTYNRSTDAISMTTGIQIAASTLRWRSVSGPPSIGDRISVMISLNESDAYNGVNAYFDSMADGALCRD